MGRHHYGNSSSYSPDTNVDWYWRAIGVFFGFILLLWLVVEVMSALVFPIIGVGIVFFIIAALVYNQDTDMSNWFAKWGIVFLGIGVILLLIVLGIKGSAVWTIADSTAKTVIDSNIIKLR